METTWRTAWDFVDDLNERGYPRSKEGRDVSMRLYRELPVLRRELEAEFRAILYPPPRYETALQLFQRVPKRNRTANDDTVGEAREPDAN